MSNLKVCVLGAGVIGSTTALELQKEFRNAEITIIADNFYKETTSFVAAGLFYPSSSFRAPTDDIKREWINSSYGHWSELLKTHGGLQVGVKEVSGYSYSSVNSNDVKYNYFKKLLPGFRRATKEELKSCPAGWKYGAYMTSLVVEMGIYLPWASNKFLEDHGIILNRNISNISELGEYDLVMNCSGLGSSLLFGDNELFPIRGQLLKVRAPWIDKFYMDEHDTYVIPGFEGTTLGCTREFGTYNREWYKYIELDIIERCTKLVPLVKYCPILVRRVGIRPFRCPVRVESEIQKINDKNIKVVHNYGHGGSGVTCAPGTAKYAIKLAQEMHRTNAKL